MISNSYGPVVNDEGEVIKIFLPTCNRSVYHNFVKERHFCCVRNPMISHNNPQILISVLKFSLTGLQYIYLYTSGKIYG
jgi:hypothetical protein